MNPNNFKVYCSSCGNEIYLFKEYINLAFLIRKESPLLLKEEPQISTEAQLCDQCYMLIRSLLTKGSDMNG